MAKSLAIKARDGKSNPDNVEKAVLSPTSASLSIGALFAAVLAACANPQVGIVDLVDGSVLSVDAGGSAASALSGGITGATGVSVIDTFALDVVGKKSGSWHSETNPDYEVSGPTPVSSVAPLLVEPVKPVMSLSGLLNVISDATQPQMALDGVQIVALVDQVAGTVQVLQFDTSAHRVAAVNDVVTDATVAFDQIPLAVSQQAGSQTFE
jgi:hypothetical protein